MYTFTYARRRQVLIGWIILFFWSVYLQAQCPQASFTLPDTICLNEPVNIVNTSTGATRYEWDFCSGDLKNDPAIKEITTIPGGNITTGITTVFDGTNWFGFVCNRNANQLSRLDFGSDLDNIPATTNLGNIGNKLVLPTDIVFEQENGNWYALLVNIAGSRSPSRLVRLSFGNSLGNVPDIEDVSNVSAVLNSPRDIELVNDKGKIIAVISDQVLNKVAIVNFGTSILTNPQSADILLTSTLSGSTNLMNVSVIRSCNVWYGFVTGLNSKLYRLTFSDDLFSDPVITDISDVVEGITNTGRLKILYDDAPVGFLLSLSGKIYRLDFNGNLSNIPTVSILNSGGQFNDIDGFDITMSENKTYAFVTDFATNTVSQLVFPGNCAVSQRFTQQSSPNTTAYTSGGYHKITLKAFNSANDVSLLTDSVFVRPGLDTNFAISNQCFNQPVSFTAVPVLGNRAVSYSWDFDDGATAKGSSVQHNFVNAKSYTISLTTEDVCGKITTTTKSIQIYNPSTANFTFPTSLCSNQPVTFTDASVVLDDPIVKREWKFGANDTSNDLNPTYTFAQAGTQTVSLTITGKSGCQTNRMQSVSVKEGANVNFSVEQTCLGAQTRFKNETILGNGTTLVLRSWDFGDNRASSTENNPTHTYTQPGTYLVRLTIENNIGCTVTRTQSVTIRQLPKATFSAALACAGEDTQFTDVSNAMDGNIAQWNWNFGETTSPTNVSTEPNPVHVFARPGTYQVKLTVVTNAGCTDSVTRTITVLTAPKAAFTFQSDCNNREVIFTDASQPPAGSSLTASYWDFGDNSTPSIEKNPRHTYAQAGAYTVRLTVTSASRCTNTVETIVAAGGVAVVIRPDTSVCATHTITFEPQVISANDPVKSWQWDFGTLGKFDVENPVVTIPASLTTLNVNLTVATTSGCRTTVTEAIPVRASATAQFSYESSSAKPLEITFANQSVNASRYEWDFGDNTYDTDASPVHTYAQGGVYEVILRAIHANGCEVVYARTLPLEIANPAGLNVFPNPFALDRIQDVNIGFSLPRKQLVYAELFDLMGRSLQKSVLEDTREGFNAHALKDVIPSVALLGRGMYVFAIRYGDILRTQKIIVQ